MFQPFFPALRMLVMLSVLTGIIYPLVVTGVARIDFPGAASGSQIVKTLPARTASIASSHDRNVDSHSTRSAPSASSSAPSHHAVSMMNAKTWPGRRSPATP